MIEHTGEVKVLSDFLRRQAMKLVANRTSAKKIGLAALDLSRTGAAQGELDTAILVDAIQSSASVGTVICLSPDELASFTPDTRSAHGWGVAETLQLGHSLVPSLAQCRITLIGIVGKDFRLGEGLTPKVRTALEKAADMVEREIHNYVK